MPLAAKRERPVAVGLATRQIDVTTGYASTQAREGPDAGRRGRGGDVVLGVACDQGAGHPTGELHALALGVPRTLCGLDLGEELLVLHGRMWDAVTHQEPRCHCAPLGPRCSTAAMHESPDRRAKLPM